MTEPFWKTKTLAEMTQTEWESLCDGCGKCCVVLLEDKKQKGVVLETDVSCRLFDPETCRCQDYGNRHAEVPGCVDLSPDNVEALYWMPDTCAYRLLAEGKPLYDWHPLVSGSPESVHVAGVSVRGKVQNETEVPEKKLQSRVVARRYYDSK